MDSPNHPSRTVVSELSQVCALQPPVPELSPTEIHIWEFPLTSSDSEFDTLAAMLSEDERARAARFHFEKDSRRFTVARASVRSILGAYVGSTARDLHFDYSRHGKPSLAKAPTDTRFSLSHSGDLAMLAVALGRDVGVDLEVIRMDVETERLAERYFSEQERKSLRALPKEGRIQAFFRCWTCKEAFVKAQGLGLSRSLASFDVEVNPGQPTRILATRPDPLEADRWFLHDVTTQPGYAAAVATEGPVAATMILRCR